MPGRPQSILSRAAASISSRSAYILEGRSRWWPHLPHVRYPFSMERRPCPICRCRYVHLWLEGESEAEQSITSGGGGGASGGVEGEGAWKRGGGCQELQEKINVYGVGGGRREDLTVIICQPTWKLISQAAFSWNCIQVACSERPRNNYDVIPGRNWSKLPTQWASFMLMAVRLSCMAMAHGIIAQLGLNVCADDSDKLEI